MNVQRIVLIEYLVTEDVTLAFGMATGWDEPKAMQLPLSLTAIRTFVAEHFGRRTHSESVYARAQALNLVAWEAFGAPLVEPIRAWSCANDLLWLVPHDLLHYLPLHALRLDGHYLIEHHPVCYTPSASVMRYCQAKRTNRPRRRALVLGDSLDNLPSAREEAFAVAEAFATPAYLGDQATKSRLVQLLDNHEEPWDVVHIACHGQFDSSQPLKSGVDLAANGVVHDHPIAQGRLKPIPDRLTVEDMLKWKLRADLVVLSACDSGVNERKHGDELIGLTRALIYAGTASVVVSLWLVNDLSTLILMSALYKELATGLNKAQALQRAQQALMTMIKADVIEYMNTHLAQLRSSGQTKRADDFDTLAYSSLLAAERHTPPHGPIDMWCPFSHLAAWAPFVLVGDWR
jgi:CHAT domain-containing protein